MNISTAINANEVLPMCEAFHHESGLDEFFPYNEKTMTATVNKLIKTGGLFIAKHKNKPIGMIAGIIYPHYTNADHITGQEMFWYVDPKHRGGDAGRGLLDSLQEWAAINGAESFMMISLESIHPEKVGQFYMKNGYSLLEHSYIRRL